MSAPDATARGLAAMLRRARRGDGGFTLVEILVASSLFLILSTMVLSTVLTGARGVKNSREYNDLNEEARVLLNRMSRELREAKRIVAASNPAGTTWSAAGNTSVTFYVDFNGNEVEEPAGSDPETLTYTYDRANSRVTLQAAGQNYPILAANVSFFRLGYTSRQYHLDGSLTGVKDGTVTWEELDADTSGTFGNRNGALDVELNYVDSMTIELTVLTGSKRQEYRTQIDLRNRPN